MGGLFSYDSKPMQILNFVGDLIILNVLYLLCCIPIFTIGAAQAGLHTGCKVLLDKEDDNSPAGAFLKGFVSGFLKITAAWGILTVILAVVIYGSVTAYLFGAPLWTVIPAAVVCAAFHTLAPLFHARFDCTIWQLIKNPWFMLFAHPLRTLLSVAIAWAPVILFFTMDLYDFMSMTPIWMTLFFSTAFCMVHFLMKKPINTLIGHYNETHGITPEGETLPEAEKEESEEIEEVIE